MAGATAARTLVAILLVWLPSAVTTSTPGPSAPPPLPPLGAHEELRQLTPAMRASWQAGVEMAIMADLRRSIDAHCAEHQSAANPATASRPHSAQRPTGPRPRPFVTLTWAQSLDGCIAAADGSPVAISGAKSLLMTHGLRAAHDAVMVVRLHD